MKSIELSNRVLGFPITITALPAGQDWIVTVLGGCTPHVGSVSLAEYENGTVTLRTLLRDSHKDQVVGDRFAQRLSAHCKSTVCVTCGIHYDGPTCSELAEIVACTEALLEELCQIMPPSMVTGAY